MTEDAEGCSDHPLASLQLQDVASGGPSSEGQQPESQAEVSALCVSPADDDLDKIIAGEWHGGECKSTCAPQTSSTQTNAIGKREICSKACPKGLGPATQYRPDVHVRTRYSAEAKENLFERTGSRIFVFFLSLKY